MGAMSFVVRLSQFRHDRPSKEAGISVEQSTMAIPMLRKSEPRPLANDMRASPRFLPFKTGKLISLTDDTEMLAAILDVSEGGACLLVADAHRVPNRFQFFADYSSEAYCCKLRWRSGHRVGVRFE
jgi:hypothetical protein